MCVSNGAVWQRLTASDRMRVAFALQERGLKLTRQREVVFAAVLNCSGHICAEHILEAAAASHLELKINKTTVYRNLDLLMGLGLITEHRCAEGRAQYEPARGGSHSHMICRRCGAMLDLDESVAGRMREELLKHHAFHADLEGYPLYGVCASCRE